MARSEVGALLGEGWVHSLKAPEARARSGNIAPISECRCRNTLEPHPESLVSPYGA